MAAGSGSEAEVGALRVSLGLESANFTQSMQEITRKIKALNSEFQAAAGGNREFEQSLDGMRARSRQLTGTLQLQQQRTQQLREEYERSVREKGRDARETENLLIRYNNSLAAMRRTESALEDVNNRLGDAQNKWKQFANSVQEASDKIKNAGEGMKNVGSSMTASITAPLAGIGLGAMKAAADVDSAGSRLRTQLGLTAEQAESLKSVAQDLWKKGFGESMEEVSDAVARVYQSMGNLPKGEIEAVTQAAFTLSKAFDADVNETTRAAGQLMQQFGVSSKDAMDMITVAFQRGGDYSDELLDSVSEYSTQFANMGFSAQQMMGMFASGAESGIFSIDKLADTVKESFLQITDGADNTRSALGDLGLDYKQIESDMAAGGDRANAAFGVIMTAIAGVTDEYERNALAIELMGTPLEDLGPQYQAFFANIGEGMTGFEGAAEKAAKTIQDSFGEKLQKLWREGQGALLPLGNVLVDMAEDVLPKVGTAVENATEWFEDLSPTAQKAAVGFGLAAAAAGPLIAGLGFVATGAGALVTAFGTVSGAVAVVTTGAAAATPAVGALATAFTVLTGPVGLTVAALAAVGLASYKVAEELKKPAIETEIFSEKVSESTQKAVGSYLKLDEEATLALNQLSWSQQAVTSEMAESLVSKYSEMGERILTSMREKQTQQLTATQDYFAQSKALTDAEEAAIVEKIQANNEQRASKITEGQERIKEILNTAAAEKRQITEAEQAEINRIQEEMQTAAVQTLSKSETEQKVILERLKNEASAITATQAAQVVANSVKQKDETVKQANEQYNKTVANIIKMRDETGVISAEQANKLIAEAKKQRDGSIKNAEEMHRNVVKEAKAQAGEHVNQVDWTTGQVKSKWQVMKDDVSKKAKSMRDSIVKEAKSAYESFTKWTGDMLDSGKKKWQNFKDGVGKIWDNVISDMKELKTDMLGYAEKIINGPVRGVNFVLEKLGLKSKKIDLWVPKYEAGTGFHPGGPALVNDAKGSNYKELIQTPDGKFGMFEGRNVLADLPRGTKVLSGNKTKDLMQTAGIPRYEKGIGMDDIFSLLSNPKSLMDKVLGQFLDGLPKLSGSALDIAKGAGDKAKDGGIQWFKEKLSGLFGEMGGNFSGSGAAMARSAITQALLMTGKNVGVWLPWMMWIAQRESGFNPGAINNWDINAQRGDPSVGLFQIINATFQRWKYPGMNDRRNPLHSALAAIRYIDGRYGGIFGHPGVKSKMRGGGYKPYEYGTNFHPGGPALVNDAKGANYKELIQMPDGKVGMFEGRNVLTDLPRGTKVLSGDETKKLMQSIGLPNYAQGVGDFTYIVKAGDTLSKIAKQFKTTVDALVKLNNIKDKNKIQVGQKIVYSNKNTPQTGQVIGYVGKPVLQGPQQPQQPKPPAVDNRPQYAKDVAYLMNKTAKDEQAQILSLNKAHNTKLVELEKEKAAKIKAITEKAAKSNKQLLEKEKETNKKIKAINNKAAKEKRALTQKEKEQIQKLRADYDKAVSNNKDLTKKDKEQIKKINDDYAKKERTAVEAHNKQISEIEKAAQQKRMQEIDAYVARKKEAGKLSLYDEIQIYRESMRYYKKNSDEYLAAEQKLNQAKVQMHNELKALKDDYLAKVKEVNQRVIDEEKRLNDEYNKALEDRTKAITGFAGLFDKVEKPEEALDPQGLIDNLHSQVYALNNWRTNLDALANRGIDKTLLEELQAMGPQALAEIKALNDMTDTQLNQFQGLWKDKTEAARLQATKELSGMKQDTLKQIEQLHRDAEKELDELNKTFTQKVTELRTGAINEFQPFGAQLKDIGTNAVKGLMAGMTDMQGPLKNKMNEISKIMIDTMKKSLEIKSPARKPKREVAKNFGLGLIGGLNEMKSPLLAKMAELSDIFTNVVPVPDIPTAAFASGFMPGGNSYDYSSSPTIHVYLDYKGSGSEGDAMHMVDIVDNELNWRAKNKMIARGMR
ncbi:phage tail tape measure protein [Pseudobacillus badius]|uniref:phage tail tape measure protein n=1 Tax=Bacillus badius TaxID=1455 RepID=UPI0024A27E9B|nr:phage tail tape measure protein [Bacillus badius]GLY09601.1 hypothetical protein Bbad01_08170 [Bacillus badius]